MKTCIYETWHTLQLLILVAAAITLLPVIGAGWGCWKLLEQIYKWHGNWN